MENKTNEESNKRINCCNSLKRGTTYGEHIGGYITKINQIGGNIKNLILEGTITNIEVLEQNGFGLISASLDDETGNVNIMMIEKGNLQFREFASKINEGKKYRVFGNVREDLIVLVKNIEIIRER